MNHITLALILGVLVPPISAHAQVPVTALSSPQQLAALKDGDPNAARNKKLVFDFWREVFVGRDMSKLDIYMAQGYIQHNPTVPTGREAFRQFFSNSPKKPITSTIDNLVAIVAEDDLVVLAFRREMGGPMSGVPSYTTTWFDMFRIEDGKIAEHWDYGTKPPSPVQSAN